MWSKIIEFSLKNRLVVLTGAILVLVWGLAVVKRTPVDVYPDIDDPRVTVLTEAPGYSPEEVEALVTFPIEIALNGTPSLRTLRSQSGIGLSSVTVQFEWGTDIYTARQLVNERLQLAISILPEGVDPPFLAPITSRLGEIYNYSLIATDSSVSPVDLRDVADWVVRLRLQAVPGIANVINQGGLEKQYRVSLDPYLMAKYGIDFEQVHLALDEGNVNRAGGFMVRHSRESLIRGLGRVDGLADIEATVLETRADGLPIFVGDVADVEIAGPVQRRGAGSYNGAEAVVGKIYKQPGTSTIELSERLDRVVEEIDRTLPPGMRLVTSYRQADVIGRSVDTIEDLLLEGAIIVVGVIMLFLFNLRSSLISLTAIPLSLLLSVIGIAQLGLTLNTMTLAGLAIAIGMVVDDAIIDVDNIFRRLRQHFDGSGSAPPDEIVLQASNEMRSSIVYATLIIVLVFVPLLTLSGLEGRFFGPLAVSVVVAMVASLVVALTVVPALCSLLLTKEKWLGSRESPVAIFTRRLYRPALAFVLRHRWLVLTATGLLLAASLYSFRFLGTEFMPVLDEGTFTVVSIMPPGTSLDETTRIERRMQRALLDVPEIVSVEGRAGRAERDEDAQGVYYSEMIVNVKPKEERTRSREDLLAVLRETMSEFPGAAVTVGQPIQHRLDHLLSGVNAQVAVKIFGEDLDQLRSLARQVANVMQGVAGVADLQVEPQVNIPQIRVKADRTAAARHGMSAGDVSHVVQAAFNGEVATQVIDGRRRYDMVLVLDQKWREQLDDIRNLLVNTPRGGLVPLASLGDVRRGLGPNTINRESVSRRIVVQSNVQDRDVGGFVKEVRRRVDEEISMPEGYYITYGGQFESQQRAFRQLLIQSAFVIFGIFILLYASSGSGREAFLIMLNLPFAVVGGIAAVLLSGGVLSVPSLVGFILLFGIAVRNGIILVSHMNALRRTGLDVREAIFHAADERVIPVLMTALASAFGMLPIAISGGSGAELLRPLAIVILGGMASSTILTLLVLPVLYDLAERGRGATEVAPALSS
ncbi:MAG: efflux RND transporter permease subunit [Gemmatimonadota bacterium]